MIACRTLRQLRDALPVRACCWALALLLLCGQTSHAAKLYWTSRTTGKIQRANLDGTQIQDVVIGLAGNYGLAIDAVNSRVYWSDINNGTISRANLDGAGRQTLLSNLPVPLTIRLDIAGGLMYWKDAVGVRRAPLNGGGATTILTATGHGQGLAIDAANNRMYLSSWPEGNIQRANLNGTGLINLPARPGTEGIELDALNSKLYLANYNQGAIGRMNLDGSGYELLVSGQAGPEQIALDVAAGKMYWGELNGGRIRRANLDGTGVQTIIANAPGVDSIRLLLDAVPEPSCLLLVAMVLMPFGWRLRARHKGLDSPDNAAPNGSASAIGLDAAQTWFLYFLRHGSSNMKSAPNRSFRTVTCRHFWSGASCLRMAVAAGAFALSPPTEAGSLSPLSTLASTATPTPNNDNYEGTFSGNTNKATFNSNAVPVASGTISNLEGIFAVVDSNGTTEYALTIQGAYNSATDPALTAGYRLQLGFGAGANFVPASTVLPELDFDFPQPSNPALPTSISLFGITPLFDLQSHGSDAVVWTGHDLNGSFFHTSLFRLPLDVPDLPASVMTYYAPGDLPLDFPQGAKAFTIRGRFIPEPATLVLAAVALVPLLRSRQIVRERA